MVGRMRWLIAIAALLGCQSPPEQVSVALDLEDNAVIVLAIDGPREDDPRPALDLTGVDPAVLEAAPRLADHVALVGCIACHTEPADEFNQTYPGRFFSDFHFHELEARAALLDAMNAGLEVPAPPFGPLQDY